jgi:hypothetical protein
MNKDLKLLTLDELLDLMIEQTSYHTQLISLGATPEQFRTSREILRELQEEITLRKSNKEVNPDINISKDHHSSFEM